jgi:hypothetical protein
LVGILFEERNKERKKIKKYRNQEYKGLTKYVAEIKEARLHIKVQHASKLDDIPVYSYNCS